MSINKNISRKNFYGQYSKIFKAPLENLLYFPTNGIIPCNLNMYNEYFHSQAIIFFNILKKYKLEFYVFAGQAIGLLRNGKNIPWVDDYDIIIFEDQIKKFENVVLPILQENGFVCNKPTKHLNGGYQCIRKPIIINQQTNYFLLDVFYTKIDQKKNIKNLSGWGIYSKYDIPINWVKPAKIHHFNGIDLPFFNNVTADIIKEYRDINNVVIHIHHKPTIRITDHWKNVYQEFNNIKNTAINNTKNQIIVNKNYTGNEKWIVSNLIIYYVVDILKYINLNNIGKIIINDLNFLEYCCSIKYYFPKIYIICFLLNINNQYISHLNYVDEVKMPNHEIYNFYDSEKIFWLYKPKFKLITVITFGTFDLFHIGHLNIINRAKTYGIKLIIGVSSDELNQKKGKKSIMPLKDRLEIIRGVKGVDEVFVEESLERKNDYIKQYEADLLIMGNDWENKFNWVDANVIYLPRTENVSTTELKEHIKNLPK